MSGSGSRASRVFTISFPEDSATQVEEIAKQESRNVSELFREAFRTYRLERMRRKLADTRAAVSGRYTDENVEGLVDEIRAELSSGRESVPRRLTMTANGLLVKARTGRMLTPEMVSESSEDDLA